MLPSTFLPIQYIPNTTTRRQMVLRSWPLWNQPQTKKQQKCHWLCFSSSETWF